jgi:hypothetical protein
MVTMNQARSITANYQLQYYVTFAQSGIGSDSTATVVTIGGTTSKTAAQLPYAAWLDNGTTWSFSSPIAGAVGKRYVLTSAASGNVSTAGTVTGAYKTQWFVQFKENGLASDATGTVVTVNASAKPSTGIDFTSGSDPRSVFGDWFDNSAAVTYSWSDPVTSSVAGKQYNLNVSVSEPQSASFNASAATTVTRTYGDRYPTTITNLGVSAKSPNTLPQYSDTVQLSATLNASNVSSGAINGKVVFRLNGYPAAGVEVALSNAAWDANGRYVVTADLRLLATGANAIIPLGKGNYAVTAQFLPAATSKYLGSSGTTSSPHPLISKEDMSIDYTGQTFVSTTKIGGMVVPLLSALVTENQLELGDKVWNTIPLQVKFTVENASGTAQGSPCVVNVVQGANGIGTATCPSSQTPALKADSYVVKVELVDNQYYTAAVEDGALTVTDPGTGFTTGGGWILDPNTNAKSNFGFTVKFLKNGSIQGSSLFIYRTSVNLYALGMTTAPNELRDYNYIIKSNSMDGLKQLCSTTTGTEPCWATFTGKSNVRAVDRKTGISYTLGADIIGNQQSFQVDVTDNGEPGASSATNPDRYAIRIWTSSGTYYQVGTARTTFGNEDPAKGPLGTPDGTQVGLSGGNVQVRLKP